MLSNAMQHFFVSKLIHYKFLRMHVVTIWIRNFENKKFSGLWIHFGKSHLVWWVSGLKSIFVLSSNFILIETREEM